MKPKTLEKTLKIGGKIGLKANERESNMYAKKNLIEPKNFWNASKIVISTFFSDSFSFCDDSASVNKNKSICKMIK